jgi:acyl-CoA synthetase (NDP forming)
LPTYIGFGSNSQRPFLGQRECQAAKKGLVGNITAILTAADAITDNGIRQAELEPPLKDRLQEAAVRLCLGHESFWQPSVRMLKRRKKTIEIRGDSGDVVSFIVVLQAEILESYVEALKSINYKGKPIIACVAGKEFAMPDVIKMEKAGIPVSSTQEPGGRCPSNHISASQMGPGAVCEGAKEFAGGMGADKDNSLSSL